MDQAFHTVLARYNQRALIEAEAFATGDQASLMARRDEFLLHVGEEVGHLLHALIVARKATNIVELGTSYGYSTLFLADAARAVGGRLITMEMSAAKQAHARAEIADAGLSDWVDWQLGDVMDLLPAVHGAIDFILLDLWKELYVPCLELFYPRLSNHAVVAADNMIFPPSNLPEATAYRAAVRSKPDLQSVLLAIGQGIELSCLWRQ